MASREPPLDEVQWHSQPIAQHFQGIHSNSVLFYFAESPFFDPQSNNGIYARQAMFNPAMSEKMFTRDQFEHVLSQMPNGVEFRVAQAPADMVTGTGVWVIVKQEREKGLGVTPNAHYFVVNENLYQAPTFGDIMASRLESISESLTKVLPSLDGVRNWTPALGNVYQEPEPNDLNRAQGATPKDSTPLPEIESASGTGTGNAASSSPFSKNKSQQNELDRLAEESFAIHLRYGSDYIDENPITGRPGEFHLSSTGRKDKAAPAPPASLTSNTSTSQSSSQQQTTTTTTTINTKLTVDAKKDGKPDKSPKTPGMPKVKRKKSKVGAGSASPST